MADKIPQYTIVPAWDANGLAIAVQEKLNNGWQCLGGVSAGQVPAVGNLFQAMIKS